MLRLVILACFLTSPAVADDPAELFQEAENLARSHRQAEAMAKVEAAVAALDRARAAGGDISWQGLNGLRFAARLAREDFLDYDKSFTFCDKLQELADSDYWLVPARLERALTYRAMGEFGQAQHEYDLIATADQRQRTSAMLPQAEMVYFDIGDRQRGRTLLIEAFMNESINDRERFGTLRRCGEAALSQGDRDQALEWYALLEKMPLKKAEDRERFLSQVWYAMGRIEESRGGTQEAKRYYRQAMALSDGEMRFRARARDALERIEYFESP